MTDDIRAVVHFTDGSKIVFGWPPQAGEDPTTIVRNVRKALEADKLTVRVSGELIVIPMVNVKYVHIIPAPSELPQGVLKNAYIVE